MAELTDAQKREFTEMWARLTREQQDSVAHLLRLILTRQEVNAEIAAIQAAAEDGRTLPAPMVH
jgi:hypothetical protein